MDTVIGVKDHGMEIRLRSAGHMQLSVVVKGWTKRKGLGTGPALGFAYPFRKCMITRTPLHIRPTAQHQLR